MDMEELQEGHLSTLNTEEKKQKISRRKFIVFVTLFPLTSVSSKKADANPLAWLVVTFVGFVARQLVKRLITSGIKKITTRVVRTSVKRKRRFSSGGSISMKGGVDIRNAVEATQQSKKFIDLADFLVDTVWDKSSNINPASVVIDNKHQENPVNTGNINIKLKDVETGNIDIEGTILSIEIPPKSRLVLDMNFSSLPSTGVKTIEGTYGDVNNNATSSGQILVLNNARKKLKGRSVDELYEEYKKGKHNAYIIDDFS